MEQLPAAVRWGGIIDSFQSSGLTAREYAEANDLNPRTLKWWRWKLGRSSEPELPAFYEVSMEKPRSELVSEPTGGVVLLLDRYQVSVTVTSNTNLALLRRVLGALC